MARTKQIVNGFHNSQKFRFILTTDNGEEVGMYITVQQMSNQFATSVARVAVWDAIEKLAVNRQKCQSLGKTPPVGIVTDCRGFRQVQIDLC